jgi:AAA domain
MRPPDANDILRRQGTEALRKVIDAAATTNGTAFGDAYFRENKLPRFTLVRFKVVLLSKSAAYLVKGLIPRAGLTVVWGPPKCGKSFWVFDLAMHVALGIPYRGRRVQQGTVVYLALEGGYGFRARVDAYRRTHDIKDAPFYLVTDRTSLVPDHAVLIADIKRQIGKTLPALVIIDTLNRSLAGSESKDEDMAAYIRAADAIREAFDCAVVIVHHCGVDATRPRGHTSLTGATDAQLAVSRDAANNIVVTVEWLKDGPEGDIITSRLEQVDLGTDADGEALNSCVIVPAEGGIGQTTKERKVKGAKKIMLDLLRKAIDEDGSIAPPSGHIPPNTRTIPIETWRAYAYQGTITESDKPDARQKAFVRAVKALQAANLVGVWGEYVWTI